MLMRSELFCSITRRHVVTLPTFRDNVSVPSSRPKSGRTPDRWRWDRHIVTLSGNVGKQLPHDAALCPGRGQMSSKYLLLTVVTYFSAFIPVTHNGNYTYDWTWRSNQSKCLFIRLRITAPTKALPPPPPPRLHSAVQQTLDKAP
jgi:hypothetical protein